MPVIKYNPLRSDLEDFPNLRVFQDTVSRLFSEPASRPWTPAVDIFETDNDLVLKADLPDIDSKAIEIQIENDTLTLKGERKFEQEKDGKGYHRLERSYGSFVRAFSLPETVDPENVKADYKAGVLTITLAKKAVAKPRSIKIDVSNN
jgi:HSP20 family protein